MSTNSPNWNHALEHAEVSDVGMRRSSNQDSYSVALASTSDDWQERGHLFLVADGMGAHAAGELASKLAADSIPHLYTKHRDLSAPESLKRSVIETNAEINRKGQANEEFHNMGTTCSVLTLLPQGAVIAHVGDSRVYRFRRGKLEQLTFDHSLVWEMRAAGQLSEDSDMAAMVPRNVITRSLGPYPDVKVDLEGPFPTEVGDTFLLCSDGLVGEVEDDELGPMIAHLNPGEAAQALVDLSNLRGGSDNVTVLVVKIIAPDVATVGSAATPLTINRESKSASNSIPAILGVLAGASLLAGLMMFLTSRPLLGVIGVVIALLFGVGLAIRQFGSGPGGTIVSGGKRFGRAPYSKTDCVALRELVKRLRTILDELRIAAVEQEWAIDWNRFQALIDKADQALEQKKDSDALRLSTRAMSFCLEQVRSQNGNQS